jgi:hypothetical protein
MTVKELTDEQRAWLVKNFKNKKNDYLIAKLGVSHSSLHRFAREKGLKKTKQFQRKCQLAASCKGREVNKRNNWPPKGYAVPNRDIGGYKKGVTPEQRIGRRKNLLRIEKSAESRRETVRAERRRVLFGLPQRTKLKVVASPAKRSSFRYVMKKRGYITEKGSAIFYYDHNTNRGEHTEETAVKVHRFIIRELEEKIAI